MKQFFLIVLTILSFSAFGQRYVLFNPVCMERLKYDASSGYGDEDYIVYAIQLSETERLFLEVGKESDNYERRISRAVITCNSPSINKDMVQQIGRGNSNEFFIVQKEGRGSFRVSPIARASYIKVGENGFEYESSEYSFQYSNFSDNRQNLSLTRNARVFFVGDSSYDCLTGYTFNVTTQSNSSKDITILPEFGVVQHRAFSGNSTSATSRRLTNVNATVFSELVAEVCNNSGYSGSIASNTEDRKPYPSENKNRDTYEPYYDGYSADRDRLPEVSSATGSLDYGNIAVYQGGRSSERKDETFTSRGGNNVSNYEVNTGSDVHIVKRQETLYRIAKSYGVKVSDIKSWNKLNSNTIYPGDRLIISARGGDVLVDKGGATSMVASNIEQKWKNTDGYHIVRYGETLSEIAAMYGMTEDRFRYINGLGKSEIIPVGYKLKTRDCDCENLADNRSSTNSFQFDNEFTSKGGEERFSPSVTSPAPYSYSTTRSIRYDQPTRWHIVRENETLYSIAKRYNTTVERLRQVNSLDSGEVLLPEQTIIIK